MKELANTEIRTKTTAVLEAQIEALDAAIGIIKSKHMLPLMMVKEEKQKKVDYLNSRKEWNFNFTSGGWNSIYAADQEIAYREACEKYKGESNLEPQENTFRVATEADTKNLLSMFY